MFAISPRYDETKLSPGTLEDKIDVFEDQILGWLVEPAKLMADSQHSGFATLAIALAYFEPLGQFLEGKSAGSHAQFSLGLKEVFPELSKVDPALCSELYNQLRCGMFHRGITKGKVRIARGQDFPVVLAGPSANSVSHIVVDPWLLLQAVEAHVCKFSAQLRNATNVQMRSNFENWFSARAI
jgi:hypothetical protein